MRKQTLNRAVQTPTAPDTSEAPPMPARSKVTVRALGWIAEDGITYKRGDTFTTTPERAAALGANVERI